MKRTILTGHVVQEAVTICEQIVDTAINAACVFLLRYKQGVILAKSVWEQSVGGKKSL